MTTMWIEEPGPFTTVQDLGRKGFRQFGVPVCGAVDLLCLQVANLLAGNPPGEGALELTMAGPVVQFDAGAVIGVAGADMDPRLNGRPMPMWRAVAVQPGDRLLFRWAGKGCRAYLAVSGGIDVPLVMGSKSTYVRGGIGGFQGRALQKGDCVRAGLPATAPERLLERRMPAGCRPEFAPPWTVRVLPGPQAGYFTGSGWHTFLNREYRVGRDADRMGCRLEGPAVEHAGGADIVSDGVLPGSIQVPGNGRPIVLLADCNTTGGYAKIATVIQPDLWRIGQARPGDVIRFAAVTAEEAREIYLRHRSYIHFLISYLGTGGAGLCFVTAPVSGVYFRSAGGKPYVQIGEVVREGQTVGLLEFMKLTVELRAVTGGEVVGILAGDREWVSAGERIVAIRPAG